MENNNTSNNYIEGRLQDQIDYYNASCKKLQKKYRILTIVNIIMTGIIPIAALTNNSLGVVSQYITAALGAAASIISSIIFFEKYKDRWIQWRVTCEKLESELAVYRARAGIYKNLSDDEAYIRLVEMCENYMANEHSEWKETMSKED